MAVGRSVASDSSSVEDPVRASVRQPVQLDGVDVLPAGTALSGVVTAAQRSGKVKGRAQLSIRFDTVTVGVCAFLLGADAIEPSAVPPAIEIIERHVERPQAQVTTAPHLGAIADTEEWAARWLEPLALIQRAQGLDHGSA